ELIPIRVNDPRRVTPVTAFRTEHRRRIIGSATFRTLIAIYLGFLFVVNTEIDHSLILGADNSDDVVGQSAEIHRHAIPGVLDLPAFFRLAPELADEFHHERPRWHRRDVPWP